MTRKIVSLLNFQIKLQIELLYIKSSSYIPKNKCGDLSDLNNYRAIAVSSALSKVLESVMYMYVHLYTHSDVDCFQFVFKSGHLTSVCTEVLNKTVNYYTDHGSHVFACFVDFSKAFDV